MHEHGIRTERSKHECQWRWPSFVVICSCACASKTHSTLIGRDEQARVAVKTVACSMLRSLTRDELGVGVTVVLFE